MEFSLEREIALVEAILYLEADPLDEAAIARIAGLSRDVASAALTKLGERYAREDSGLELSRIGGGILISPKKEYWDNLKERYGRKNEVRLSKAAMETLAIIAYSQPVTRGEIEGIRGVQADTMIRLLLERGLVRETGKKNAPGKPIQYGTTREFLKFFRLESIADLPKLNESETDRFELEG
ncbi:MAG: SMC-Scp complex subunit ScpB [Spirochaetaceae bacterium]|jgi:segregation and condensation protein B|nr:SMC-Scp complex subunit ScpB [Spirochaetaceae bacterium]